MKLSSYFPWINRTNDIFYGDEEAIRDAVKKEDISNLARVFLERRKFRSTIAYYFAKLAGDELILCFIKQISSSDISLSPLLLSLGSAKRLTLAKHIFYELGGRVEPAELIRFISQFVTDTPFLKDLLKREVVKPSVIILHLGHLLASAQITGLLSSLSINQFISVLTDCEEFDDLAQQILTAIKTKEALTTIFNSPIDSQGNTFLHLASPLFINKLSKTIPIPSTPVLNNHELNPLEYALFTGNFARVMYLKKWGLSFKVKSKADFLTEASIYALECNEDKFKYNAIVHMLKQANIELPSELHYIHKFINNPKSCRFENIDLVKPYLVKLAEHYLKRFEQYEYDHLVQIQYAMTAMNHDFALEILSHAGYMPEPLKENLIVFRGAIGPLDEGFITSFFEVGYHSSFAFKNGNGFNCNAFLNYDTKSSCANDNIVHYEFCGNYCYLSLNPYHSLTTYAGNRLKKKPNNLAFLIEARLEAGAPRVVGSNDHEFEYIVDFIPPKNIKAIYLLDGDDNIKPFFNPNYVKSATEEGPFFEKGQPEIDRNKLVQAATNNRDYYEDKLAKYRRPSIWNNRTLLFNKKRLPEFLALTHGNIDKHHFKSHGPTAKIEIETRSCMLLKQDILQPSSTSDHLFFASWSRRYEQDNPEKCTAGYGPGALICSTN